MRLTRLIKDQILHAARNKMDFSAKEQVIIEQRAAWAEKARIRLLGGEEKALAITEALSAIETLRSKLPKNINNPYASVAYICGYINVGIGGQRHYVNFSGSQYSAYGKQIEKVCSNDSLLLTATDYMAIEYNDIQNAQDKLDNESREFTQKIQAILASLHTKKQLLELWPEAIELFPAEQTKAKNTLPAIQISELNKELGLPSEVKA